MHIFVCLNKGVKIECVHLYELNKLLLLLLLISYKYLLTKEKGKCKLGQLLYAAKDEFSSINIFYREAICHL